ncbi:MAG: ParB/RepB/Spo0J family partition protein [Bacteroidetes bacterium]|nr:ParB/RepB/Spo0J family partition protein [Bacteroidota bacterium]MCB0844686.1 ParB/RepB/Spo0J family partition protein [Bacteroidota bacterium]
MSNVRKRKGLGRGLDSILPTNLPADKPEVNINLIPVSQIERNPFQPRSEFDEELLKELADSIKEQGIIQPLTVRKLEANKYQLIAGERRLKASKIAGLTEVPAYLRTANDEQMLEMALIENIQREDLNPIEIAFSYQRMIDELGLKQTELGDKVGKNRASVANYLRLLKLPPKIMNGLKTKTISFGHGRALIGVKDPFKQEDLYNETLTRSLSVRQLETLIQGIEKKEAKPKVPQSKEEMTPEKIQLRKVTDQLTAKFGNKVKLNQNDTGKGEITIPFNSKEDLNRILEIIDL